MPISLNVLRVSVFVWGNVFIYVLYLINQSTFPAFVFLYSLVFCLCQPTRVLSPLTILYLYYGAWFIFAPATASIYDGQLELPEYRLAFAFAFSIFSVAALSLVCGERLGQSTVPLPIRMPDVSLALIVVGQVILYIVATTSLVAIVLGSGGFQTWIDNPGDAFLNRGGTGVYVILSHFSSLLLAMLTALSAYRWKRYSFLFFFVAWVVLTSPVHGSKLQIALLIVISFSPWLVLSKFWSAKLALFLLSGVAIFILGMLFRHQDILRSWGAVLSTANYFTALQNLAISNRDFEPSLLTTFFLPYNKIWLTFGWVEPSSYFDMNHMLTDIYYPERWQMRATEQWPVETDMYLNFYFFGGAGIIALFFFLHGWLFGYACKSNSAGAWFAVVMLTIGMISHLRGSLYNHVDFYLYPYILISMIAMAGWKLKPDLITNSEKFREN